VARIGPRQVHPAILHIDELPVGLNENRPQASGILPVGGCPKLLGAWSFELRDLARAAKRVPGPDPLICAEPAQHGLPIPGARAVGLSRLQLEERSPNITTV